MEENNKNTKIIPEEVALNEKPTELRQDLVTDDWVVIATGRSKRPKEFSVGGREPFHEDPKQKCFFCYPEETGQERDVLIYRDGQGDWSLRVFPNKYPAFLRGQNIKHLEEGPYFKMDSVGFHEIVVPKDHSKQLAQMDVFEIAEIFDAYQVRYIDLMNKRSVNYIEIFHNHGKEAGASIAHPHSQIMAMPVIAPYTKGELDGAENYFRANQKCVYCTMIGWEKEHKKRVVFENDEFIVFCPFASRAAFEMWIVPKKHKPYFERISNDEKMKAAEALQTAISKMFVKLNDPALNFYIHTSPCDGRDYPHYHWHIEIVPRISIWAGLELSTGIEISTIEPEKAAEFLREA